VERHLDASITQKNLQLAFATIAEETCIWAGILLLAYGIFSAFFSVGFGVLFIIFAGGIIAYAVLKGREKPKESTLDKVLMERERIDDKVLMERERIEADPALEESVDAEKLYDELLTQYVYRWGPRTGTVLLREEVRGYLRQGISFPEALKRIHARKRI